MNDKKERRDFESLLRKYGLEVQRGGSGHMKVMKQGNCVTSLAHSTTDPHYLRRTVSRLVRDGHLPKGVRV
jgi:hypothetical protein